jgi:hypothetical protein
MDGLIVSCRYLARIAIAVVGFCIAIFYMAFIALATIPACVLGTLTIVVWNSLFSGQHSLSSSGKRLIRGPTDAVKRAVVVDQEIANIHEPIPPHADSILPLPWQHTSAVLPSSSSQVVRNVLSLPPQPTRQQVNSVLPPIPQYYFNISNPMLVGLPPTGTDRTIEIVRSTFVHLSRGSCY